MASVFLDTNVIAYRFDGSEPQKQAVAAGILEAQRDVVISTQVMLELHAVLTRKLRPPLSTVEARGVLDRLSALPVVVADAGLVRKAAATSDEHQLSIWDSMIIEAAAEAGCDELWTEDLTAGSTLRGVRVVNPFA